MRALPTGAPVPADAPQVLAAVEAGLDPAQPETAGVEVLAYGEISCALLVPGLPGWVAKRMSGLADGAGRDAYVALVEEYLQQLRAAGVHPVTTLMVSVDRRARPPVVYLLQPLMPRAGLGSTVLREGSDDRLVGLLEAVLARVSSLHAADRSRPAGEQVAIDAQLSNWWQDPAGDPDLLLLDVGTPFMRRSSSHRLDQEMFLSAVPPGVRAYYRSKGDVAAYLDDYFDPRTVAVDLLGNFHKEGRADRVPLGIDVANTWLDATAPGAMPVTEAEVAAYYRQDADQLALFLRVRRLDRLVRTRLFRGRYDFVLPGRIDR